MSDNSPALSTDERRKLLDLARQTLTYAVEHGDTPTPGDLNVEISPAMEQTMGAFVTIKKNGQLRGCIGEIVPVRPLYQAVMAQALNAGLNDPRFMPVERDELPQLEFDISAYASAPRPVNSYTDIELGRHGIVLEKRGRQALFLPQVAPEQGWDLPTTLTHLAVKAGLPPDAWQHGAQLSVFEAIVFGEKDFE